MTTLTIARLSLKDAIRKRILLVTLLFAVALLASSPFWPAMTDADRVKLVKDISLSAMAFFGIILAVFVSAYALPSDIDEKRIFTIATKPVHRHQILFGKLLGFLMMFLIVLAAKGVMSNLLIRAVSTYQQVEVIAAEAPVIVDGAEVGAISRGRELRLLAVRDGYYTVRLPEDLVIDDAIISAEDVTEDRTKNQVQTVGPTATLTRNNHPLIELTEQTSFGVKERLDGAYRVALPRHLRIEQVEVPSGSVSSPARKRIVSRRQSQSAGKQYQNKGSGSFAPDNRLILSAGVSSVGETWHFNIDTDRAPDTENITAQFRATGIYGVIIERNASGRYHQNLIDRFDAQLRIVNRTTGEAQIAPTEALWGGQVFAMQFTLPRSMLAVGELDVTIARTTPQFITASTDRFEGTRTCTWQFRNMPMNRFDSSDRLRGELALELHRYGMPAHGGLVADVQIEVSARGTDRSEIITVPVRHLKRIEFDFDAKLASDGNVDITVHSVPETFSVGVPYRTDAIILLQRSTAFEWSYFKAIVLIFLQIVLIATISISASTFLSGGIAALVGFFAYFIGLLMGFLKDVLLLGPDSLSHGHHHGSDAISGFTASAWPLFEVMLNFMVRAVPDLTKLDAKAYILDGLDVPARIVWHGIGMTALYAGIVLLIAWLIFRRRQFG